MSKTAIILAAVASLGVAAAMTPALADEAYVADGSYGIAYGPGYYGPTGYGSYAYYGGPNYYGPRFAYRYYHYRTIHR